MNMRERMARAIYENIDVDSVRGKIDVSRAVDAALDALTANPGDAVINAAFGASGAPNEYVYDFEASFCAAIRAIKEGK